jgi:hypothetical protein
MYYIWNQGKEKINNSNDDSCNTCCFEQVSAERNVYNRNCYCHFMFGMMQLSAKTPRKNQDNQDKEEKRCLQFQCWTKP